MNYFVQPVHAASQPPRAISEHPRALRTLTLLPKLIGVFPLSLSNSTLTPRRLLTAHTLALLAAYTTISVCAFLTSPAIDHTKAPNVSIFREIVDRYLYFGFGVVCVLLTLWNRGGLMRFFEALKEADKELLKLGEFSENEGRRFLVRLNASWAIAFTLILAILIATESVLEVISHSLFVLIILGTILPFVGALKLLENRFKALNSFLGNPPNHPSKLLLGNSVRYRVCAGCHDGLCDGAAVLNGCYTLQMLGFFTLVFLGTLFAVFGDFRVFFGQEGERGGEAAVVALLRNSYVSAYMVCLAVAVLRACEATCDQANETGKMIHKIINNNSDSLGVDYLKTFSLQLMHRSLSFNACYMFNLDYTLLYTLIGASTTYMVILIQFDLAKPTELVCNATLV